MEGLDSCLNVGDVWRCDVGVLTGESLLVVLPHGDEIPQTGIELFHDALQEMERFVKGAELQHVKCAWVIGRLIQNLVFKLRMCKHYKADKPIISLYSK